VEAAHAFVPEIFGELVHAIETTYDQPFQVKLVGNAQVQSHIQGIVVRFKRTRRRATRKAAAELAFPLPGNPDRSGNYAWN
jgi:hypothetical protein